MGFRVLPPADSAGEALARAAASRPDLVLMDIRLRGERDGIDTASELRARYRPALVYLTAHSDPATLARAGRTEPLGYLDKPVRLRDLESTIEIALARHLAEGRLRERERWLTTTLRSIGDAVICLDGDARVWFLNPAAERMTGWPLAEALGQRFERVVVLAGEAGAVGAATLDALTARPAGDLHVAHRSGGARLVRATVAPMIDGDQTLGAAVVLRDRDDERRMERELELADRLSSLGTMAAGMAHEINNPLSIVTANLEYLRETLRGGPHGQPLVDPDGLEPLDEVVADSRAAALRIRDIVADLVAVARPVDDSGPSDLAAVVGRALHSAGRELRGRARIVTELAAVPAVVGAEPRLIQVVSNLLVNAARAIEPGAVERNEVRVVVRPGDGERAVLEIHDTGAGIPADLVDRVFEPFFTTRPIGGGTGLGLTVCHGIVTSLGGAIQLHSQVGRGTTVRIELPLAPGEPDGAAPAASLGRLRILVIDDEPMVLSAARRMLAVEHEVETAPGALEALDRIAAGARYDVILCDVMMPGMDGIAFCEELGRRDPALGRRLVFISGGALEVALARALDRLPNRKLAKPIGRRELDAAFAAVVAGR
jgi:PAS domain S-box-containing protein